MSAPVVIKLAPKLPEHPLQLAFAARRRAWGAGVRGWLGAGRPEFLEIEIVDAPCPVGDVSGAREG